METTADVIKLIRVGYINKITLSKKGDSIELWWEDQDKWFLNVLSKRDKNSHWIIAKDLPAMMNQYLRNNYKIKKIVKTIRPNI